jgi:tetratricopeptide (TPR) repeat protein
MPGHIYAQSDKIQEAIAAFTAAAENELTWLHADSLYPNGHHGHNVHFLIHALNLGGRYQDSIKWARHLMTFRETPRDAAGNNQRVPWRQAYFGLVKTLVRFEKWDEILDGSTLPVYDKPEQQAWRQWAMGLAYSARGQQDRASAMLSDMKKSVDAVTSATEPLLIGTVELEATIAARGGNRKKGFDLFRKAASREAAMLYTEPPAYPRPVVEGFGNVALAVGDYAAAEKAYRDALAQEPGSGRAYFGLAAALDRQNQTTAAAEARGRALKAWIGADADLPQLRQARPSTAGQNGR